MRNLILMFVFISALAGGQTSLFLEPKNLFHAKEFKHETWSGEGQLCGKKICLYTGPFFYKNRVWLIKKCRNIEEATNELFVSRFGLKNGIPTQMVFPEKNNCHSVRAKNRLS